MRLLSLLLFYLFIYDQANSQCDKICRERAIAMYDVVIRVPKPTDPKELITWNALHSLTHHYISTIYNIISGKSGHECFRFLDYSSRSNGINSDASNPSRPDWDRYKNQPMPLEPQGRIDYSISGEVVSSDKGRFIANLIILDARRHVVHNGLLLTIDYASDLGIAGNSMVLELLGGHGQISFASIIYAFEKERRDGTNNMAFNPDFMEQESTLANKIVMKKSYTAKSNEQKVITFVLQDCDGVPLKDRKIMVTAQKGKVDHSELHTNTEGIAYFVWTAPDENTEESINVSYKYDLPSDRPDQLNENIAIKVSKPREEFNVTLKVTGVTIEKEFDNNQKVIARTELVQDYSVDQMLSFNNVLFNRLEEKTQNIDYCTTRGGCVLMDGNSDLFKPTAAQPTGIMHAPVTCSFSRKAYSICDDKFLLVSTSDGGGTISDYIVTTMISIYKYDPSKDDFKPTPLVQNDKDREDIIPVPLTNASHFAQLSLEAGSFRPSPGVVNIRNYNCQDKKWVNSTEDGIKIPGFSFLIEGGKSIKEEGNERVYINPIIPEVELMNYLRNPIGMKTFTIKARSYEKTATIETQTDIYITLTLQ